MQRLHAKLGRIDPAAPGNALIGYMPSTFSTTSWGYEQCIQPTDAGDKEPRANQFRRPCTRWRQGRRQTNIPPGPLSGGPGKRRR